MKSKLIKFNKLILSVSLFLLAGCVQSLNQQSDKPSIEPLAAELITHGNIIDLHTGKAITPAQLVQQLSDSSLVIVGEKHDNRYHHQIERWLVQQVAQQRPQGAVLLEMLVPAQQPKVDQVKQWLRSKPYVRDETLQHALAWQQGWPWEHYGEFTKTLLYASYPLLAANLDRQEITQLYDNPIQLTGTYSTQPTVREMINQMIDSSHGGQLTAEQINKMTTIQQMRDRRMAQQLLAAPRPAWLFAGGYHATRVVGVPLHVQDLASNAEMSVLILSEQGSEINNMHADYVWYTPSSS
ncbi:ChaN family lipoprotein [Moellerella wisconsensis]|uniref:ChaN family lipoprotein n=1 Tax=Moellerella wisconsensis TaxID=158849 RepID=A0ACD3Y3X3_9GAMM|nr:ChaN family lipoprotein [Moellerella wisconsensis]UNH37640.1 ChaN family lipoprotein [Moellerella wisconsensis]UNH41189.1 ChaN family lipoprotein [Moellerella wisconsensis]